MSQCPQGSCGCTAAPGEAGHPGQSHCLGPKKAEAAEEILGPTAGQGPRTCWSFLGRPPHPRLSKVQRSGGCRTLEGSWTSSKDPSTALPANPRGALC